MNTRIQQGFSLVELMVALTLGLVVVGGVVQIYLSNKQSYRMTEAVSRIQENARFAMELLTKDLRAAGHWGCAVGTQLANTVNDSTPPYKWRYEAEPIMGYEDAATTAPQDYKGQVYSGTDSDSFAVAYFDANQAFTVSAPVDDDEFDLTANHTFAKGTVLGLVLDGCGQAAVFQLTNQVYGGGTRVAHATSGTTPANCGTGLSGTERYPLDGSCPAPNVSPFAPATGSRLMPFVKRAYYIRAGASGEPALWRGFLTTTGGNPSFSSEELVEGVEDMQLLYGVDTDTDGTADSYVRADDVADWTQVVSVRVDLLLRSLEDDLARQAQPYVFHGANTTPGDRRVRRAFTTVVALRNRLP